MDYHSLFEVPVFRTGDVLTSGDAAEPDELPPSEPAYRQPPTSRITVTRNQRGTEIFFAAARNPGVAVGSTIFTMLWTAFTAWLISWEAPALFSIVFGAFDVVLVFAVLQFWLGVSRVRAGRGSVSVAQGYIVPGRERTIDTAQIDDIMLKIGMQASTTPYYDVVIVRKDGKQIVAGRSVRDKREAEWLAATIRTAVGLKEPEVSADSWPLLQA